MPNCLDCEHLYHGGTTVYCDLWSLGQTKEFRIHRSKVKACETAVILKYAPQMSGKVLEIGPGANQVPRNIISNYAEWTGIDAVWRENPGKRCFRGRAHALPFEDRTFDWVVAIATVEHWNERRTEISRGIKEVVRVLKFGGKFLATVPMFNHGEDMFFFGRRGKVEDTFRSVKWSEIKFEDWSRDSHPLEPLKEWKKDARAQALLVETGGAEPTTYTIEVLATK